MSPKSKKKLEEKIVELEKALEDEKIQSQKYLNQLKYTKADLDNLQKQSQKRINDVISRANGRLLLQLLPIVDEIHMAVNTAENVNENILVGVNMVKGKLLKLLETEGVKPIEAVGKPFDPRYHEAVFEVDTKDHPDGYVMDEIRGGYTYNDRILRASMVKVARNTSSESEDDEDE